ARKAIQDDHSLGACRNALRKFNEPLLKKGLPAPTSTNENLRSMLKLDEAELKEINDRRFTPLDDDHLDMCFLLRDAALALELDPRAGSEWPADKRAAAAFAWVMRHVRVLPALEDAPPTPPQFVLRRGLGSFRDRALVFVSL